MKETVHLNSTKQSKLTSSEHKGSSKFPSHDCTHKAILQIWIRIVEVGLKCNIILSNSIVIVNLIATLHFQ